MTIRPPMGNMFTFGKSWRLYIDNYLDTEIIDSARPSLVRFFGEDNLKGTSFLDLGCGSGPFFLAALRLSTSKILSFDVDMDSVGCCEYFRQTKGKPAYWQDKNASILDSKIVSSLGKYKFEHA